MSEYIAFSPVDWPLFERLRRHTDGAGTPSVLAELLAGESYWSHPADDNLLAVNAAGGAFANSALPALVATRVDSLNNAERAAPFLLDEDLSARERCQAELARSGIDYPLLYDPNLLLACHSSVYAAYLFGDGELVGGKVAYDGPPWLAKALGGPVDPQTSRFAMLTPADVARLARDLESHDPQLVIAELEPELRDFHRDNFGEGSSLEGYLEEALELLDIFYSDAALHGWGFLIHDA